MDGHVASERDLVLAFQAGSPGADEEIYRLCRPVAERICRRLLSNPDDADEALQETLLRVFQALARFNGQFALRAWVARIATNVCLDTLRARSRRPENGDGLDEEVVALFAHGRGGGGVDPCEILEQSDEARRVRAVLATLPHAHRAALILREFEGLSHEEIAWALDLTPAKVKALIHRAKRGFRRSWGAGSFLPFPLAWLLRRLWGGPQPTAAEGAVLPPPVVMSAGFDGAFSVLSERFAAVVAAVVVTSATVSMAPPARGRSPEPAEPEVARAASVPAPDAPAAKATTAPSSSSGERSTSPEASPSPSPEPSEPAPVEGKAGPEEAPPSPPPPRPTPSPSPEPSVEPPQPQPPPPQPPQPPQPPPYSPRFDIERSVDYGCECGDGLDLVHHFVRGQPGADIDFGQRLEGAAHDAEGDPAWRVKVAYDGSADPEGSRLEGSFVLWTPAGSYHYDFGGTAAAVRTGADGVSWYVFDATFSVHSGPGGFDRVPRSGTVRAELAWQADGTPVRTALTLTERKP